MTPDSRGKGLFATVAMVAAVSVVLATTSDGQALTRTANVAVIANVNNNCSVLGNNTLAFGAYSSVLDDASATVRVKCNRDVNVLIRMGEGLAPQAGSTADAPLRQMSRGASRLRYLIYRDAARTLPWGDSAATGLIVTNTRNNLNVSMYGRIPGGQFVGSGAYADTVIVSIDY